MSRGALRAILNLQSISVPMVVLESIDAARAHARTRLP
jgi:hypothetical protein